MECHLFNNHHHDIFPSPLLEMQDSGSLGAIPSLTTISLSLESQKGKTECCLFTNYHHGVLFSPSLKTRDGGSHPFTTTSHLLATTDIPPLSNHVV